MKKRFLAVLLLVLILIPTVVLADMGPKPSINIKAVNMPDSTCYIDLLVEVNNAGEVDPEFLEGEYNQNMVRLLSSYYIDGWGPAVVNDELVIFSDIKCEILFGECTKHFGYMPPDRFKIVVISEDGNIVVSNIVEKNTFDSTIDFDYKTGIASERKVFSSIFLQFLITCSLTLLIEGLILLAFKFSFKKYWLVVLLVNILTQILLTAAISISMLAAGLFGAIFAYLMAEFIIFIIEGVIFGVVLKQHKVGRRVLYALTANIMSFAFGLFILIIIG